MTKQKLSGLPWKKIALLFMVMAILINMLPIGSASAATESIGRSYTYNRQKSAVQAPPGYLPDRVINVSKVISADTQWIPSDLFRDDDNIFYIIDTVDGAIQMFDKEFNYKGILSIKQNGTPLTFKGAQGMFVKGQGSQKRYYICDTEASRVVIADASGNVIRTLTKPSNSGFAQQEYKPSKVLVDKDDLVYVIAPAMYYGAMVYDQDGDFINFFGGNKVEGSIQVAVDKIWKKLFPWTADTQAQYVPVSPANFDIDPEGYIYTVTNASRDKTEIMSDQIKKFNAKGLNIFSSELSDQFGEQQHSWAGQNGTPIQSEFSDISIMKNDTFVAVDQKIGRLHVFDSEGNKLMIFGGIGNTPGTFSLPVAVESLDDTIYVLDQTNETVTIMKPTEYGSLVLDTTQLNNEGRYDEAQEGWMEIIQRSGGYFYAYTGVAKALMGQNKYEEAMKYYKLGDSPKGYSQAFGEQRKISLKQWFPVIFILVILVIAWFLISDMRQRKIKEEVDPNKRNVFGKITYTLFHPGEGSISLTRNTSAKSLMIASVVIVAGWFIITVISKLYTSFQFGGGNVDEFEFLPILLQTFLIFAVWCIANWFVCTIMDSSARMTDIIMVSAVALIPFVCGVLITTIMSHFMTQDEAAFMSIVSSVTMIWSILILLVGFKTIHELSLLKTIFLILIAIVAMFLIAFLAFLVFSLFQQITLFISQIWDEVSMMVR